MCKVSFAVALSSGVVLDGAITYLYCMEPSSELFTTVAADGSVAVLELEWYLSGKMGLFVLGFLSPFTHSCSSHTKSHISLAGS